MGTDTARELFPLYIEQSVRAGVSEIILSNVEKRKKQLQKKSMYKGAYHNGQSAAA